MLIYSSFLMFSIYSFTSSTSETKIYLSPLIKKSPWLQPAITTNQPSSLISSEYLAASSLYGIIVTSLSLEIYCLISSQTSKLVSSRLPESSVSTTLSANLSAIYPNSGLLLKDLPATLPNINRTLRSG